MPLGRDSVEIKGMSASEVVAPRRGDEGSHATSSSTLQGEQPKLYKPKEASVQNAALLRLALGPECLFIGEARVQEQAF